MAALSYMVTAAASSVCPLAICQIVVLRADHATDGQYLVRRSIDLGEPITVVGINYRLGALGLLSSKELRDEARMRGEAGYNNLGLHDQRVALQWVAQHIHHFGGDGSKVTIAGESAGAISVFAYIRGEVPVAQNALLMSCARILPCPVDDCQRTFNTLTDRLGLRTAPSAQKLAGLRSLAVKDLQALVGVGVAQLSEDDNFFTRLGDNETWEGLTAVPSWIHAIMIGQTRHENILFAQRWAATSAKELHEELSSLHEDREYDKQFFEAYGIKRDSSHAELVSALEACTSDALFSHTTHSIATTHLQSATNSSPKVYRYSFD